MDDGFDIEAALGVGDDNSLDRAIAFNPQAGNGAGIGVGRSVPLKGGRYTLDAVTVEAPTEVSSTVETMHPEYVAGRIKWDRARDVCAGQDVIHSREELYLARLVDQPLDEYRKMVKRSPFYNASWRTVAGFVGMLSGKPANVKVPNVVEPMLDDVTLTGLSLEGFLKNLEYELLITSRAGVLIDYPEVEDQLDGDSGEIIPRTQAQADQENLRPVAVMYGAEAIFNWQFGRIANKTKLTQVRLYELDTQEIDEFQTKLIPVIKVLDIDPTNGFYRIRKFERKGGVQIGEEVYPKMNGANLTEIPFWIITPDGINSNVDDPILIDLFDLNIMHYKVSADYEHVCHLSAVPTPYVTGVDGKKAVYLGSQTILQLPDVNCKAGYIETSGNGIGAIRANLESKEAQMAAIGARMLAPEKSGVEAADTVSMRHNGENSILSSVALSISNGMKEALDVFSAWAGAANADCSCEVNRDFSVSRIDGPTLLAYIQAVQTGNMSKQTFFDLLKRGDLIAADVDYETEQARIAASPPPAPPRPTGALPGQPPAPGGPPKAPAPAPKTPIAANA